MNMTIDAEYYPSPYEMAKEIWENMDCEQQADLLYFLFCHGDKDFRLLMQMDSVAKELEKYPIEDRNHICWMLSELEERI